MMPSIASPSTRKTDEPNAASARSGGPWGLPDRFGCAYGGWHWLPFVDSFFGLPPLLRQFRQRLIPMLCHLVLIGACGVLASSETAAPPSAGFDLLADISSSKLDTTSAEAPPPVAARAPQAEPELPIAKPTAEATVVQAPPDKWWEQPLPATVPAATSEPPLLPIAADVVPVVQQIVEGPPAIPTNQRGDSPMMRTWRMLGLSSLLATALTAPKSPAGPLDGPPAPPAEPDRTTVVTKQLDDLKSVIDSLKNSVGELRKEIKELGSTALNTNLKAEKAQSDITKLNGEMAELRKDMESLRRSLSTAPTTAGKDVEEIKAQLDRLRLDFDSLRKERVSLSPPTAPAAVAPTNGRVRLVNTFDEQVTIIVNSRAFRLAPGESRLLDPQAAGPFNYQVLGVQQDLQNRTLAANETITITVYPR